MRAWIETLKEREKELEDEVARRVRAWIETFYQEVKCSTLAVARRVRAWIETNNYTTHYYFSQSHAVCVRGLKLVLCILRVTACRRTPCACVD